MLLAASSATPRNPSFPCASASTPTTAAATRVGNGQPGLDEAAHRPRLRLFIEWDVASTLPGRLAPSGATLGRIELECDVAELGTWLGPHARPLDVRPGATGIVAVAVQTRAGQVVLERRAA